MDEKVSKRFWKKVAVGAPDECWPWQAYRNAKGYGQFRVNPPPASQAKASRVAWELQHGQAIPPGLFVCHTCDNPPCCNPNHLFLGTNRDNMADMARKGRAARHAAGHLRTAGFVRDLIERQRRLTDEQIAHARRAHAGGESCRSIARRMGVAHTTISRLINGTQWRNYSAGLIKIENDTAEMGLAPSRRHG